MNKSVIDTIEIPDHEDGSKLTVTVYNVDELGNNAKPGVQFLYMGNFVNFEPLICAKQAYQARKAGQTVHYLEGNSWTPDANQYVKCSLVLGSPPKARVEAKTRSSKPVTKEYPLPFNLDE